MVSKPQNRASKIVQMLEEDILTGRLRPGDRLDERQLGERFGLSRTPVREALLQLTANGLATSGPRRSTVVAEITLSQLIEMFEVMVEMEALCAASAARRMTPAAVETLHGLQQQAEPFVAAQDYEGYYRANVDFHQAIYAGARNAYLERQTLFLSRRLSPFRRLQLRRSSRLENSHREHGEIVAAIRAGDADRAAGLMRGHMAVQDVGLVDVFALFSDAVRGA